MVWVLKLAVHLEQLQSLGWGGNDSGSGLIQVHVIIWDETPWGLSVEESFSIVKASWGGEGGLEAIRIISLVLGNHVGWLLWGTVPVVLEVHEAEAIILFLQKTKEITKIEWLVLSGCSGGSLRRSRSFRLRGASLRSMRVAVGGSGNCLEMFGGSLKSEILKLDKLVEGDNLCHREIKVFRKYIIIS